MTLYAIFTRPERGPETIEAVKDRFVWSAALGPPIWAVAKQAWGLLALWVIGVTALVMGVPYLGKPFAISLYGLFALWIGFAAPGFVMRALTARGWIAKGDLVARDSQAALTAFVAHTYGRR